MCYFSTVISAAEEPLPGWIDNYYGPTGGVAAASLGILRNTYLEPNINANLVPVDYTANAILAAAWDVATLTERYVFFKHPTFSIKKLIPRLKNYFQEK